MYDHGPNAGASGLTCRCSGTSARYGTAAPVQRRCSVVHRRRRVRPRLLELDCGGPVVRALATARRKPEFQFPQDENPHLKREGWAPRLWDYFYVSLTNSIAFGATDAMPLTRPAKALMAAESALSAITVLLVAARAVNILR